MMLDKDSEDFTRVPVVFQGLANLLNTFPSRIAMAVDIPETRFRGHPADRHVTRPASPTCGTT